MEVLLFPSPPFKLLYFLLIYVLKIILLVPNNREQLESSLNPFIGV